jgi:hypothetical protein
MKQVGEVPKAGRSPDIHVTETTGPSDVPRWLASRIAALAVGDEQVVSGYTYGGVRVLDAKVLLAEGSRVTVVIDQPVDGVDTTEVLVEENTEVSVVRHP